MTLSRRRSWWLSVLGLALVYYAAGRLGLLLAFEGSNASPVWPPSGIALAALVWGGRRLLPGVAVGAFAANAVVFAANGAAWPVVLGASLAITVGNSLEAWLGATLLRKWVGKPSPFERLADVAKFIIVAALASVTSAAIGTATLLVGGVIPSAATATVAWTWWTGDTTGILVVAPLVIALGRSTTPGWSLKAMLPALGWLSVVAVLGTLVFAFPASAPTADRRMVWLFMPCIAWAAYRHGPLGVAAATLLTASLAVWGTTRGLGPFSHGHLNDALIVLQTFVGLAAVTGLVLAADRRERQQLGRQGAVTRDLAVPWAVLLGCLGVAVVGWHLMASDTERRAHERFGFVAADIRDRVATRMVANEQVLRGAAGLFAAANEVRRDQWRAYVQQLELARHYPGIQGVSFAPWLRPDELVAHQQAVRAEGLADYVVHPPGERAGHSPVAYIEPFDERNRRAVGFDIFSEAVRRAALERARDTDEPTLSGKVALVQENGVDVQVGALMCLPVFQRGQAVDTVERRRAQLRGFVCIALRLDNLMRGALGPVAELEGVAVRLYGGRSTSDPERLMFDSAAGQPTGSTVFRSGSTLSLSGQEWTLLVQGLPQFEAQIDLQKAQIVLIAGVGLSLLLFALVRALTLTRERALLLAEDMNAAVRDSQAQFRSLAESASEAIVIADADGRVRSWNRAAAAIFGHTEAEILGKSLIRLMPERFRAEYRAGLARVQAGGPTPAWGQTVQLTGLRADGHEFPIELSLAGWDSAGGRFYSGIIRDISQRVAADTELKAKTEALQRSNAELAQFAYVASHDLKEPLRTVASYSQLLSRRHQAQLSPEGQEFVQLIGEGAKRAQALVSDLLSLARLDSSAGPLSPVPLQEVLDEARRLLATALQDSQAELSSEALPWVLGDRAQLLQLLQNLIDNAIKFRRPGVPLAVHLSARREADGAWRIDVTDNGIGIEPRFHEQIFTIFQRLHRAEIPGTGIGLAICKKVVERHGGRIGVESIVGQGSTFFFTIAAAEAEVPDMHRALDTRS